MAARDFSYRTFSSVSLCFLYLIFLLPNTIRVSSALVLFPPRPEPALRGPSKAASLSLIQWTARAEAREEGRPALHAGQAGKHAAREMPSRRKRHSARSVKRRGVAAPSDLRAFSRRRSVHDGVRETNGSVSAKNLSSEPALDLPGVTLENVTVADAAADATAAVDVGVEQAGGSSEAATKSGVQLVAVDRRSPVGRKLFALARVVRAVALHDLKVESGDKATEVGRRYAEYRADLAKRTLEQLNNHSKISAVDIQKLAIAGGFMQTAESMRANGALLTASDISTFLAGFRGEDYGTAFAHNVSDLAQVSVQGDILGAAHEYENASSTFGRAVGRLWTGGKVSYCFASDTSYLARDVFTAAVHHYQASVPCINFEEVALLSNTDSGAPWSSHLCNASNAIIVTSDPQLGCFSSLGMMGWPAQQLNLHDPGCTLFGTAVHELGHALGMTHEHPREMVSQVSGYVHNDRIKKGRQEYFNIDDSALRVDSHLLGYERLKNEMKRTHHGNMSALTTESDPLSIMHFDPFAFANEASWHGGLPSFRYADLDKMGQRSGLAHSDVKHLLRLYAKETNCKESPVLEKTGCIDGDVGDGADACSSLTFIVPWCSATARANCCRCGGGVTVQCFEGEKCSRPPVHRQAKLWREELYFLIILICISVHFYVNSMLPAEILQGASEAAKGMQGSDRDESAMSSGGCAEHACDDNGSSRTAEDDTVSNKPREEEEDQAGPSGPGAFAVAKAKAKSAFKALSNWINRPATFVESFADKERPLPSRLSDEAVERYNKGFAPCAGGFSSGREAPPAELLGVRVQNANAGVSRRSSSACAATQPEHEEESLGATSILGDDSVQPAQASFEASASSTDPSTSTDTSNARVDESES
eukprot:TRINITY_DN14849_c0_g3_i1.p1 TRINITY_DN14849_c0_g3~~TRINITY_DN14849_c0_g3_i1.p1  ORF type:complete len:878 (-),score=126.93 TRINITY_DN14849_c0_g3_i1:87-2720(-)